MNRIKKVFQKQKKILIGYTIAAYPHKHSTEDVVLTLLNNGVDIVEIGIPYSDPLADGPVISKAAQKALSTNITIDEIFESVRELRKKTDAPLLFLVYYNTIYIYGKQNFFNKSKEVGIDGLIIPDLPYEEKTEITNILPQQIINITLVAPNSNDRLKFLLDDAKGFVYAVSSLGVTGRKSQFYQYLESYIAQIRKHTNLPIAIGFGIKDKNDKQKIDQIADASIIGTKIIEVLGECDRDYEPLVRYLKSLF